MAEHPVQIEAQTKDSVPLNGAITKPFSRVYVEIYSARVWNRFLDPDGLIQSGVVQFFVEVST